MSPLIPINDLEQPAESPAQWTLDPDVIFLNHGSFGACPQRVLDTQSEWRARLERQPVDFLVRELEGHVDAARASFAAYADAARLAHSLGLGINAGHDLDLDNLTIFRQLPHLAEVSIGHAIVSRAIFDGLEAVIREYLAVLADA